MAQSQESPWIDQLTNWISQDAPSVSKREVERLLQEVDIAITMADSLVECSEQLRRLAHQWTQKHDKLQTNR